MSLRLQVVEKENDNKKVNQKRNDITYHVDGLVSELDVQTVDISIRMNSDGLDSHLLGSPDHTASNLSSVGDQDLVKGLLNFQLEE